MSELLPALAFSLVISAQFLAVIAVHALKLDKPVGSADIGKSADVLAVASIERI